MTRACVAAQTRLGQALLSDASALHRRISGLEQERDTARAQTVAAVTAEAAALRRLERDIHDGPQQRLVRLAIELGRAQHHFDSRPEAAREALADAIAQTQEALDELRALSRGIAPPILVNRGLREALTALAARSTTPVELDAAPLDRRLDAGVETAAYFVIAEALTNVAKHSHARRCAIGLRHGEGTVRVWVTDDGVGGAALDKGHGLRGLDDRLHAAGGWLQVTSPSGGPTTITAELPDNALGALTARERQLLALMAEGHSNTAIAQRLVISASAVEKHISNVFAKLGLPPDDARHRRVLAVLAYLRA